MIETKYGMMDETFFEKREGVIDNEDELTTWVEYWSGGSTSCPHKLEMPSRLCVLCPAEQVHRSVDMKLLKAAVFAEAVARQFA